MWTKRRVGHYCKASVTMKVENLTKVYASASGKLLSLNNVSFSVDKGEFVSWQAHLETENLSY